MVLRSWGSQYLADCWWECSSSFSASREACFRVLAPSLQSSYCPLFLHHTSDASYSATSNLSLLLSLLCAFKASAIALGPESSPYVRVSWLVTIVPHAKPKVPFLKYLDYFLIENQRQKSGGNSFTVLLHLPDNLPMTDILKINW